MQTQIDERQQTGSPGEDQKRPAVGSAEPTSIDATPPTSALAACVQFLRDGWLRVVAISAAVLIPCFWHKRIEAGDLASHTYNAWLAQLIERGQAPGLWLAKQWSNILFDISLSRLGNLVGLSVAEKICVSTAVLIFFWGAFALIGSIARRTPWPLAPCIAMFAYGWTFQQGFMNYYISVGLALLGIALLYRGKGLERALILLILPLAWMAHPLGAVILVGLGSYVAIASNLSRRQQMVLLTGACILMFAASLSLMRRLAVVQSDEGFVQSLFRYNGADQLVLYGERYELPAILFIFFGLTCLALDTNILRTWRERWDTYFLPLQLYGLTLLAAVLVPVAVTLPGYAAPFSLIAVRLTSVTAVLACCLLGTTRPKKWHLPCYAAIASAFFALLYSDTGKLNKMEQQAESYERVLPPGQRIIATIWPFVGSRLLINHVIDRACIGYCFSYGDYEPSSGQFLVRAMPGNRVVIADPDGADEIQSGDYVVKAQDLPIFEIYQCNLNMTELCMRELTAGDRNGAVGVQPRKPKNRVSAGGLSSR